MGFKETLNKYFNNHSETGEKHWDPELRTHYFKTTKDKAFDTLVDYFKRKPGCQVLATSEPHGEISINYRGKRRAFIIVTVIMVKPLRTAVDFSITTEGSFLDLGFSHNLIKKLYQDLKNHMTLIDMKS
ncbi:cytosolic protein [Amphibacillus sediminis]|uniref:cytosolic protein n=1 Tax=Amphibacillus sediminis TaxID=360185 RepID=UPI000829E7BC|nr:cytosolic protein [Amphibacillus sediminis]